MRLLLRGALLLFVLLASRVPKKSSIHDLKLAVESCLPIINSVLNEIRNKAFPSQFFLNIAVPTDVSNHKVIF